MTKIAYNLAYAIGVCVRALIAGYRDGRDGKTKGTMNPRGLARKYLITNPQSYVNCIKAVREAFPLSLQEAKGIVDSVRPQEGSHAETR
jgi:ribosomal protein L7/L12